MIKKIALSVIAIGGLGLASPFVCGFVAKHQIEKSLKQFGGGLYHISVRDYHLGWLKSTMVLDYDLSTALASSGATPNPFIGMISNDGKHISQQVEIHHGPIIIHSNNSFGPIGFAYVNTHLMLPEKIKQSLKPAIGDQDLISWHGLLTFGNVLRGITTMPGVKNYHINPKTTINWNGLSTPWTINLGSKVYEYEGTFSPVSIDDEHAKVSIQKIEFKGSGQMGDDSLAIFSKNLINIPNIKISEIEDQKSNDVFELDQFKIQSAFDTESDVVKNQLKLDINHVKNKEGALEQLQTDLILDKLPRSLAVEFVKAIHQPSEDASQNANLGLKILTSGLTINLKQLDFKLNGDQYTINTLLKFPKINAGASMEEGIKDIEIIGRFKVPQGVLVQLMTAKLQRSAYDQGLSEALHQGQTPPKMEDYKTEAQQKTNAILQKMAENGFLKLEGNYASADFEFAKTQLKINGKVFDPNQLDNIAHTTEKPQSHNVKQQEAEAPSEE